MVFNGHCGVQTFPRLERAKFWKCCFKEALTSTWISTLIYRLGLLPTSFYHNGQSRSPSPNSWRKVQTSVIRV